MNAFSRGGENGTGVSGAAIRLHGRIEILERLLGNGRCDLGAEAAGSCVFVQHQHLRGLSRRLENRRLVPRHHGAEVDDLHRYAVVVELLRRLFGGIDHRAPGDQRDVGAFAVRARLAERHRVPLLRNLTLDPPVEVLVLEVEDGVRVLDRADQEALRILGRCRADAFQSGDVGEGRLGVLRVERAAGEPASRREPDGDRNRRSGAVALLRRDGDEVIPCAGDEVGELHLGDGAQAHHRRAGARADDRRLGQRSVHHPPVSELLLKAERHLERAAVHPHVLADHEDALVAPHLRAQPVGDRLQVGQLGHATYL